MEFRLRRCELAVRDDALWERFHDLDVPARAGGRRRARLGRRAARAPARAHDRRRRRSTRCSRGRSGALHEISAIGHAHLDTAWLWPLEETYRKLVRSDDRAAAAARRLSRAPSSPTRRRSTTRGCATATPELYAKVREAVAAGPLDPRRRHMDRARLQPAVRGVAGAPVPLRPAVLRGRARPPLHGVLEPGRLRLHRPAPAADARGRDHALPDPEAVLEPLQPARAPHVHLAGPGRLGGPDPLPARRHLQRRGDGRRAAPRGRDLQGPRPLAPLADGLRARRRRRRADRRDARAPAPGARHRRAAEDDGPLAGRVLRPAGGGRVATCGPSSASSTSSCTAARTRRRPRSSGSTAGRRARCARPSCCPRSRATRRTRASSSPRSGRRCCSTSSTTSCPGSSITEVNVRARADLAGVVDGAEAIGAAVLGEPERPVNLTPFARREVVGDALYEFPPYGAGRAGRRARSRSTGCVLANEHLRATLSPDGTITSLRARRPRGARRARQPARALRGRADALGGVGHRSRAPRDRRRTCRPRAPTASKRRPLRAEVVFDRDWLTQTIRLDAGSRRLEVTREVDWQLDRKLLKVAFPLAVRATDVTYEVAFGAVQRPTHYSTRADLARYEVPGHRWADMSEHGFGVAVLTDAKYGYSAFGNTLRISLLRAPRNPDPEADRGQPPLRLRPPPPHRQLAGRGRGRAGGGVQLAGPLGHAARRLAGERDRRARAGHGQARGGLRRADPAPLRAPRRPWHRPHAGARDRAPGARTSSRTAARRCRSRTARSWSRSGRGRS